MFMAETSLGWNSSSLPGNLDGPSLTVRTRRPRLSASIVSLCTDICQHPFTCTKQVEHSTTVNIRPPFVVTLVQANATTYTLGRMLFWVTVTKVFTLIRCDAISMSSCINKSYTCTHWFQFDISKSDCAHSHKHAHPTPCPWEIDVVVELFIRHLLSASSWKRRVLFPHVALPRTTGRRQEAFHSATKVRRMTMLTRWDTREKTAQEGTKTGKVGSSHVHLYGLFLFSCHCVFLYFHFHLSSSPVRSVFFFVCLFLVFFQSIYIFSLCLPKTPNTKTNCAVPWYEPISDPVLSQAAHFSVRLNFCSSGCSKLCSINGAVKSDRCWINCSPTPIWHSDEFLTYPKSQGLAQLEQR